MELIDQKKFFYQNHKKQITRISQTTEFPQTTKNITTVNQRNYGYYNQVGTLETIDNVISTLGSFVAIDILKQPKGAVQMMRFKSEEIDYEALAKLPKHRKSALSLVNKF